MATINTISYLGETNKVPAKQQRPLSYSKRPDLRPPVWQTQGNAAFRSASSFGSSPMQGLRPRAPLQTSQSSLHSKPHEDFFKKQSQMQTQFFSEKKPPIPDKKAYSSLGGVKPVNHSYNDNDSVVQPNNSFVSHDEKVVDDSGTVFWGSSYEQDFFYNGTRHTRKRVGG
jgi:hypothetical protein